MLDAHRLRVFRAVVAAGSINLAANRLGYTPSAVSQQLAALQRETGLALVERRGRGIHPTPAGLRLASDAGDVLERLAELESLVGDLRDGRTGNLTMRYVASAGLAWMPPVVATLSREFPELRLDLRLVELSTGSSVPPDLEIRIDGTRSDPTTDEAYDEQLLLEEPYLAIVPVDHPLAGQATVPLIRLRDEPWVDNDVSRGPCRQILLDACASLGFATPFQVEVHDYPTAIAFVAAGVGITVVPRLGAATLPPGVCGLQVVEPDLRRRIMLRVKRSVADHPAIVRAVELLRERVQATSA